MPRIDDRNWNDILMAPSKTFWDLVKVILLRQILKLQKAELKQQKRSLRTVQKENAMVSFTFKIQWANAVCANGRRSSCFASASARSSTCCASRVNRSKGVLLPFPGVVSDMMEEKRPEKFQHIFSQIAKKEREYEKLRKHVILIPFISTKMSAFEEILSRVCVEKSKTSDKQIRNAYAFVERLSQERVLFLRMTTLIGRQKLRERLRLSNQKRPLFWQGFYTMYFEIFPKNTLRFKNIWNAGHYHFRKSGSHYSSAEKTSLNNPELLRNMIVTMAQDVQVILLKLSERLYEMRHLEMSPVWATTNFSQKHCFTLYCRSSWCVCHESTAGRSPFYLSPKEHSILSEQMFRHEHYRDRIIRSASEKIQELLHRQGIESEAVGRIKHLYSVSQRWNENTPIP